jgi:hypothetical protein
VLDEIGQPRLGRVEVKGQPALAESRLDLGRGQVGQQPGDTVGEDPHDGDVARCLLDHRIAIGLEAVLVDIHEAQSDGALRQAEHPARRAAQLRHRQPGDTRAERRPARVRE